MRPRAITRAATAGTAVQWPRGALAAMRCERRLNTYLARQPSSSASAQAIASSIPLAPCVTLATRLPNMPWMWISAAIEGGAG
jgi:hypothetical protein